MLQSSIEQQTFSSGSLQALAATLASDHNLTDLSVNKPQENRRSEAQG